MIKQRWFVRREGDVQVVKNEDGSTTQPISVLDKHRLLSNSDQIGTRVWDHKWGLWDYHITKVIDDIDVTDFIED